MQPPCWPRIAGIILGTFREIPTVHNLPFTPPVPARAWLLFGIGSLRCLFWAHLPVNPAPVQLCISFNAATLELLCISFNAATLELVQDWQAPLPVPGMVAGESCACTPMSRSELAQDRWPTLPVPARSELAQDWWPTLPVLDTVAGESCTHTHMHNLASYLLLHFGSLHWNWFRTGSLHCLFWVPSLENPASVHLSISIYIGNGSGLEASAGPPPLV
ncbi:hypothetical protein B0H13DRAFT_1857649 [Mycena leptocephala]|nr:hypothetical protein B0H13DRAFT_1857649 [Mycena leptocephala]